MKAEKGIAIAIIAVAFALSSCGGKSYDYKPQTEIPEGPGVFSGEDGEFTVYDSKSASQEKEAAAGSKSAPQAAEAAAGAGADAQSDEAAEFEEFQRWKESEQGAEEYREFQQWQQWREYKKWQESQPSAR